MSPNTTLPVQPQGWRCPCGAGVAPGVAVCPECRPSVMVPSVFEIEPLPQSNGGMVTFDITNIIPADTLMVL